MLGHGCISQCGLEVIDALLDPELRRHHYTHGERNSEGERERASQYMSSISACGEATRWNLHKLLRTQDRFAQRGRHDRSSSVSECA